MDRLRDEIRDAAAHFSEHGHWLWTADCDFARQDQEKAKRDSQQQSPSVLAISSLTAKPVWQLPEASHGLEMHAYDIWQEYTQQRQHLPSDLITQELSAGGHWQVRYLMQEGHWHESALSILPVTRQLLQGLPVLGNGLGYVYFSELAPGSCIAKHCGPTNIKLRIQLTLQAKHRDRQQITAYIQVADQVIPYAAGQVIVFDDSFAHTVQAGDLIGPRVVLVIDIWHPDLWSCPEEQAVLSKLFPVPQPQPRPPPPEAGTGMSITSEAQCAASKPSAPFSVEYIPNADREGAVVVKLLIVGDAGCGKSSFVQCWAKEHFSERYIASISVDFKLRTALFQEQGKDKQTKLRIQFFDVAGPEKYRSITASYYRGAMGIVLAFDVCNRRSFESVPLWIEQIRDCSQAVFLIVGMKADRHLDRDHRDVSAEEAQLLAERHELVFVECSCKDGHALDDAVNALLDMVVHSRNFVTASQQVLKTPSEKKKSAKCAIS